MHSVTNLPEYSTEKFSDIYKKASEFLSDYHNIGITPVISDSNASLLFYLLYGRYGNNPIANWDITQWKYKIFSVVFQYGPTWEKRLEVQKKLRELSTYDEVTYERALKLRAQQQDIYNKWKFYKGLQLELNKERSKNSENKNY